MKRRILKILFAITASTVSVFAFSACNFQNGEQTDNDHVHSYEQRVIPPTCTEQGYTLYNCTDNDHVYEDKYVDAIGHNLRLQQNKAPTCTEKGWEEYKCTRCDYTTKVELAVDPNAHQLIHHNAQASTCTQKGWKAYETCSYCDYTTKVELEVDPNAHQLIHHNAQSATCTKKGCNEYDTCALCDYTTKVEIDINPNAHAYEDGTCVFCGATKEITYKKISIDRLSNLYEGWYTFTVETSANYTIMFYCGDTTINLTMYNSNNDEIFSYDGGSGNKLLELTAGTYTFDLTLTDALSAGVIIKPE